MVFPLSTIFTPLNSPHGLPLYTCTVTPSPPRRRGSSFSRPALLPLPPPDFPAGWPPAGCLPASCRRQRRPAVAIICLLKKFGVCA